MAAVGFVVVVAIVIVIFMVAARFVNHTRHLNERKVAWPELRAPHPLAVAPSTHCLIFAFSVARFHL